MFVGLGRVEEFEVLLRRSESFYVTALLQAERGMYDLAVFSLEQSLQLFLKAALLKKGVDFPRTHGVRRLLNMLAELTGSDEIKQAPDISRPRARHPRGRIHRLKVFPTHLHRRGV
jgi:HEPN domain-containing protein